MAINVNNLVKVGQLQTVLTRVASELDDLDARNFGDVSIDDGKIKFFAVGGDSTPLKSIDLPADLYLDQTKTSFVQSFAWSNVTYPNSTNPNLEGKPVLVLAVKDGSITTYSFLNMESLVDTFTAADKSIAINDSSIAVNFSTVTGNLVGVDSSGVFVGHDASKLDTISGAKGNFVIFGSSNAVDDAGFGVALDTDINTMLTNTFGAQS